MSNKNQHLKVFLPQLSNRLGAYQQDDVALMQKDEHIVHVLCHKSQLGVDQEETRDDDALRAYNILLFSACITLHKILYALAENKPLKYFAQESALYDY